MTATVYGTTVRGLIVLTEMGVVLSRNYYGSVKEHLLYLQSSYAVF